MDWSMDGGRVSLCWKSPNPLFDLPKMVDRPPPPTTCSPLLLATYDSPDDSFLDLLVLMDCCKEHAFLLSLAS